LPCAARQTWPQRRQRATKDRVPSQTAAAIDAYICIPIGGLSEHATDEHAMAYVMVDVESDGPIPGDYSMICFGAVLVKEGLQQTFYGRLKPISDKWIPEALAISGFTREDTLAFDDPKTVMEDFARWVADNTKGRALFVSDNNGFDFAFVSWYFWHFTGANPFGHSSTNLGSLYKGLVKDTFQNFKHLRKTEHTHHPVDDARGNAEAMLEMKRMGLKIAL
jgi:DNA polymerase III epsilon subunit-like protein